MGAINQLWIDSQVVAAERHAIETRSRAATCESICKFSLAFRAVRAASALVAAQGAAPITDSFSGITNLRPFIFHDLTVRIATSSGPHLEHFSNAAAIFTSSSAGRRMPVRTMLSRSDPQQRLAFR